MTAGDKREVSAEIYDVANRYLFLVRQIVLNDNISGLGTTAEDLVFDKSISGTAYISMLQTLSGIYRVDTTLTNLTTPAMLLEKNALELTLGLFFSFYPSITNILFPTNEQITYSEGNIGVVYDPELDSIYNGKDWDNEIDPMMYGDRIIYKDLPYIPDYKVFQSITNVRDTITANTNIYQNNLLIGAKIIGYIGVNHNLYDTVADNIRFSSADGTLDFTSIGGLFAENKILIMTSIGVDETAYPIPPDGISYWRKKEVFTNSTNLSITLQYEILNNEMPQVFFNGMLLSELDYEINTTAGISRLLLKIHLELTDTITIFYIANII